MKKIYKVVLTVLLLMPYKPVFAEEKVSDSSSNGNQVSESTTESSTIIESTETVETEENDSGSRQTTSEEEGKPAKLEYFGEDENGGYSLPQGRSDLNPGIQLRSNIPAVSATNNNTPSKNFVDISSHNGNVSTNDFLIMKKYGVTGVVVKLTEGTGYINPYAAAQVKNAKAAGMKVSAYHYSWFKTNAQASAEADYFAKAARNVGLDNNTVMVNDMEEPQIAGLANHTSTSIAFETRLKQLGFKTIHHYVGLYWINSGLINADLLGNKKIWVAAYPYTLTSQNYYTQFGAWQWSSRLSFPGVKGSFDISADYTKTFSSMSPQAVKTVNYSSHVQDYGWTNQVSNGQSSGTTGKGKQMEAMKISLSNDLSGNIEYQSHIQGIGWEKTWKKNNQISGTEAQSRRLEAVKIKLSGTVSNQYDVYYRVHTQKFGWMNWAKNGQEAGTEGLSYRIEAMQVKLVPKGQAGPTGMGRSFVKSNNSNVIYRSHVQGQGWVSPSVNGEITGTTGKGLRMEGLKVMLPKSLANSGSVEYRGHVQRIGWQNWTRNDGLSGTEGKSLRLEAIQIRLTGALANRYDIVYRTHSQKNGWLGWTKNGSSAGTQGFSRRIEAVEIKIVPKNSFSIDPNIKSFEKK
ncbi:hypothetical protein NRIC_17990 [Enterococcus florum]|uniref:Lysozyme n=1 Tax=Enterococcus florum TaxID=2480627 RepID=A0A4P5PD22_9ENTE|nr:GH25 family lysozyme [Enterococcus florum]GCF93908.1 hypothetical protein NRIC_17990 [Enterococcus florum]